MKPERTTKTVTQFRGLHAMSATAAPIQRPETTKRSVSQTSSPQSETLSQRNAA